MNQDKFLFQQRRRRRFRVRKRLEGTPEKPRLSVFRSHKHIACQVIDDAARKTLVAASTRDQEVRDSIGYGGNIEAAAAIGKLLAERATAAGIKRICFDRGNYQYHGRVAALADAAREGGLEF